jgi:hypothetical protein
MVQSRETDKELRERIARLRDELLKAKAELRKAERKLDGRMCGYKRYRHITPEHRQLALTVLDIGYKELAKEMHPDKGGNAEDFSRLLAARDWFKAQIL